MGDDAQEQMDAIQQQRMAQLQAQQSQASQQKAQEEQMKRQKAEFLTAILEQDARARLNSIAVVKPEKAERLENLLISMAQRGQLPGKVNEKMLKGLLEQVSQQQQKKTTNITFARREFADDSSSSSDDDDDDSD